MTKSWFDSNGDNKTTSNFSVAVAILLSPPFILNDGTNCLRVFIFGIGYTFFYSLMLTVFGKEETYRDSVCPKPASLSFKWEKFYSSIWISYIFLFLDNKIIFNSLVSVEMKHACSTTIEFIWKLVLINKSHGRWDVIG